MLGPTDSAVQAVAVRCAARRREVGHSRRRANQVAILCALCVAVQLCTQNPTANKVEGPCLSFIGSTFHRCKSRQAFIRSCLPGKEAQFFKGMQDADKRGTEFFLALAQFEKVWNDTPGYLKNMRGEF